ncbi:MAG: Fe-S-containing protein [Eubacteriales bacterium]|nr:Fe-S-containing protein [Eubacteriales bacterium]
MTSLFLVMGIVYAFVCYQKNKINLAVYWGSLLIGTGVGFALFLIKINNPKATNLAVIRYHRYMIVFLAIVSLLAFVLTILAKLRQKGLAESRLLFSGLLLSYGLFLAGATASIMPTIFQYTTEFVYFGEDSISSMMLLRVIGFVLGLSLVYLLALSVYHAVITLPLEKGLWYLLAAFFIQTLDYGVRSVTSLQRLKIIPLNDVVFQIMIFGDNHGQVFLFAMLGLALLLFVFLIVRNRKIEGEFKNPAQKRKEKAKLRNRRRWGYGLLVESLAVFLIVTVVHYYDTKEVELTPPQDYQTEGNFIVIPLEDIADGHLHRFSYHTPNGFDVRFIAVKKPQGTTYGLGLDACDICGIAGYYERGDDVICKRCDVVMNKNTIGFYGGCNPVPFPYEIKNAKIFIDKKDLEKEEMRFR